jgi:hypothetical protein
MSVDATDKSDDKWLRVPFNRALIVAPVPPTLYPHTFPIEQEYGALQTIRLRGEFDIPSIFNTVPPRLNVTAASKKLDVVDQLDVVSNILLDVFQLNNDVPPNELALLNCTHP